MREVEKTDSMFLKALSAFFVSMLPIVELRGGIPLGTGLGLPMWICYPVCILGNLLPVPFILFFAKSFLDWTAEAKPLSPFWEKFARIMPGTWFRRGCAAFQRRFGPLFGRIIRKAEKKAERIGNYELLGLCLFVAVPIPGTGAWMGTLVASILRVRTWKAVLMISLGVLTSGVILMLLCLYAPEAFKFLMGE